MNWYIIVFTAYIVYKLIILFKNYWLARQWGCKPMEKYGGRFGIKSLINVIRARKEGFLVDYQKQKYIDSDTDTIKSRLFHKQLIHTKNAENVKAVVATQYDDFSIGKRHKFFRPLLGNGIFASEGERWKHSRAMLRPQFARERVAHVQTLEPHLQVFAKHVRKHKGQAFDIQSLFHKLTIDAATEFLFGESVDSLRDTSIGYESLPTDVDGKAGFDDAFNISQNYMMLRALAQDLYFLFDSQEFRDANRKIHKFTGHYVHKALETTQEELDAKSRDGYIFLYELVKQTRDPVVLQDELLSIMLAGRNTTASLLSFLFFELARNPEIWSKLKEEIYEHFGTGDNVHLEKITFESMKKCTYLKWVINETLRMYPSVPQNFRVAKKDTTLPRGGGEDRQSPIFVPKGQFVLYTTYSMHRLEAYYGKDADTFRPERWENLRHIGWAYMPFSSGPRVCLGQQFALTEASYITIRLAQMFPNIESHDPNYPPRKLTNSTMKHLDGVFISLY